MDKISLLEKFQEAHNQYFRLLMENYPSSIANTDFKDFGPPELCDLAIEVHSCAIALGPKALSRFTYLGLDILYPFDNPVDLYNWRAQVKKESIDHTIYASIAIRIDSELKRMRRIFSLGYEECYETVPTEEFLESKSRYKLFSKPADNSEAGNTLVSKPASTMHIDTVNVKYAEDAQAVNKLETLEKETTIGSNVSNIITVLRTFFGG